MKYPGDAPAIDKVTGEIIPADTTGCVEPSEIFFDAHEFVLTGAFKDREGLENTLTDLGARISDNMRKATDYLVIATAASAAYGQITRGGKHDQADRLTGWQGRRITEHTLLKAISKEEHSLEICTYLRFRPRDNKRRIQTQGGASRDPIYRGLELLIHFKPDATAWDICLAYHVFLVACGQPTDEVKSFTLAQQVWRIDPDAESYWNALVAAARKSPPNMILYKRPLDCAKEPPQDAPVEDFIKFISLAYTCPWASERRK